jgi:hypothetical protein
MGFNFYLGCRVCGSTSASGISYCPMLLLFNNLLYLSKTAAIALSACLSNFSVFVLLVVKNKQNIARINKFVFFAYSTNLGYSYGRRYQALQRISLKKEKSPNPNIGLDDFSFLVH